MWYENSFRRHLCDMHIEDWNPRFMSQFDPEAYVDNLKRAKVSSAMLYFQSHVGLCYFPTKTGKMHAAFRGREDAMRRVVDLCHDNGINVTGYYSLIYNTVEHDRHPEWRLIYPNGFSQREGGAGNAKVEFSSENAAGRYGMCCPNNMEYRAFVKAQIEEMAQCFPDVEGMFYDMLFWPDVCYCDKCRERWAREVGGELPHERDWKDKRWLLHAQKRREWMGEFAQWVTDLSKSTWKKEISVEHNVACSALCNAASGNAEEVIAACDYAGGDLYRSVYHQSFACKFFQSITKNQPFEYMFSRCAPRLAMHTQIKSLDVMRSATFVTAANHGATLVIDAIDPVGTLDTRVYERIGEVFSELEAYEPYMKGTPIADVGIYYSLKSQFDPYGDRYINYTGVEKITETMIDKNVLWGITGGFAPLDRYKIVVASELTEEDAYDNDRLVSYVEGGGNLYISGGDCKSLIKRLLGADVVGRTRENVVYVAPADELLSIFGTYNKDYPLHFNAASPILEGVDERHVLARIKLPYTARTDARFASIHSDPPGVETDIPAVVIKPYGKGRVIWSAMPIECESIYDYRDILISLLEYGTGAQFTLTSDAPDDVEITAFEDGNSTIVHAVLFNTKKVARRVGDVAVAFKCSRKPKRVVCVPEGKETKFELNENTVSFTIDQTNVFKTYQIEF